MGDAERAEYVCKLRAALGRGASLSEAAKAAGKSKSNAHRVALQEGLGRRKPARRLSPGVKRAILRDIESARLSLRQIARLHKRGFSTVQRLANPVEPGGPRKVRAYRCPGCEQLVNLRPCVICTARAGRGSAGERE